VWNTGRVATRAQNSGYIKRGFIYNSVTEELLVIVKVLQLIEVVLLKAKEQYNKTTSVPADDNQDTGKVV
jgi:hypothetical protein